MATQSELYREIKKMLHNREISNASASSIVSRYAGGLSARALKLRFKHLIHRLLHSSRFPAVNFAAGADTFYKNYAKEISSDGKDILLISHEMTLTGAPRALLSLAVELRQAGLRPLIVSLRGGGLLPEAEAAGIEVKVDPLFFSTFSGREFTAGKVIATFPTTVYNTLDVIVKAPRLPEGASTRTIGWIHEAVQGYEKAEGIERFDEAVRLLDEVYAVSGLAAEIAAERCNGAKNIGILPICILPAECASRTNPQGSLGVAGRRMRFLVAGSISHWKGCDIVDIAISMLPKSLRNRIRVEFAGAPTESNVVESLKAHGSELVVLTGQMPHDELAEHMRKSDVVLCPSLDESLSMVCIEAMQMGKPVITTDATGISSFMRNMRDGIIVNAGSAKALAEAMRLAVENPDAMAELGIEGKNVYLSNFTPGHFREAVRKIFVK